MTGEKTGSMDFIQKYQASKNYEGDDYMEAAK